jgi:hypothetical protein
VNENQVGRVGRLALKALMDVRRRPKRVEGNALHPTAGLYFQRNFVTTEAL